MKADKFANYHRWHRFNHFVMATIFIIAGAVLLGHNLGYINDKIFHIVISWQMALMIVGVVSLFRRNLIAGLLFLSAGAYFTVVAHTDGVWIHAYWPVILIVLGIGIALRSHSHMRGCKNHCAGRAQTEKVEDGYVTIDMSFGSTRHIVLDPVFRGAHLDVTFGSVALDLRRTTLEADETFIDINCSFGGVEFMIPSHWNLIFKSDNTFGGYDDKRRLAQEIDYTHKLVIRGDISFSGVEIKD